MRVESFEIGKTDSSVQAYLHEDPMEGKRRYPALIVLPGGGYCHLSKREADPVALHYFAHAVNTFTLYYPIGEEIKKEKPVETVRALVEYLHKNAEKYEVDEKRLAIIGFSAGGHLAASYSTLYKGEGLNATILGYPVITSGPYAHSGSFDRLCHSEEEREYYSLEKRVTEGMKPTFIFHSADDASVPVENSLLYAMALSAKKVPYELHIYPSAKHGMSVCSAETASENERARAWLDSSISWLFDLWKYKE